MHNICLEKILKVQQLNFSPNTMSFSIVLTYFSYRHPVLINFDMIDNGLKSPLVDVNTR